jgi:hypothetical protein
MQIDISKVCSDFLRFEFAARGGKKLKASHSRELTAAFFGYKSHAALLTEKVYPLERLGKADVLVPNVGLIEQRRNTLVGLPADLFPSREIASKVGGFLKEQQYFGGKVWLYESLETYVTEVLLIEEDSRILDQLSGVMAETNAYFDSEFGHYESAEVIEGGDAVTVEVEGQYSGSADPERPFCGDQIDMRVTVDLPRIAGRVAFANPEISARGEVNDDWVDPELRYGSEAAQAGNYE